MVIMDAASAMDEPSFRPDIETVSGRPDSWPCSALEAALILGVSERTIRRAIARGELVATKRGGLYRIAQEALTLYQQRQVRSSSTVGASNEMATPTALTSPFIPRPLTSFVGRAFEMAAVMALLERGDVRLLTLTGPGGVGKTRLSGEIISRMQGTFRDGVWFVPLAGLRSPDLVLPSIALALGLRETGGQSLERRLRDYLRLRHVLLVVDNFEHVLPANVQIGELLQACPNLTVLVTSRAPLRLQGEQEFPVPALAIPEPDTRLELARLAEVDAVALFAQRARAAQPDFDLTPDNAAAVLSICRRVDGLPLAIELAAARIGLFSPASLLARMERRLPLLSGGTRDQPARLRTMYDAIAWSYDLLTAEEQALFRRLAVFVDGVTIEAAEAMALAMSAEPGDVVEHLTSLLRQSVLRTSASPQDGEVQEPRMDMFETIREFALEQLTASGEEQSARAAHADWFRTLADRSASYWFTGQQQEWADRWEAEHGNLRAALEWTAATESPATLLRLTAAIWPFWFLRSHYAEGRMWLERALAGTVGECTRDRSHALNGIASVSVFRGDAPQVTAWCRGKPGHREGGGLWLWRR